MASGGNAIVVKGLKPLLRDFGRLSKDLSRELRAELATVAAPVAIDTKFRLGPYSAKSVRGVRVRVNQRGVSVQQSARKSKNLSLRRSNYGALQMEKAFEPALADHEGEIERRVEDWLDRLLGESMNGRIL